MKLKMQGKYLYEYAVIRVLPRIEREEFINIGIILFSKEKKYINFIYEINENRISLFLEDFDIEQLKKIMDSYKKISLGDKEAGEIAKLDVAERFRWLTSVRSSCIQVSPSHSGFSNNLDETTEVLFQELVL